MGKIIEYGWYFLIAAILGEVFIPFILAIFYKGYSHTGMALSSLGNIKSPVRTAYNIWMLLAGILFLLSLPVLFETYRVISLPLTVICVICVAVFAVGACIFTCFFSVNGSKDIVTAASMIHGAGSALGFMLLLFVPLILAVLSFKSGDSPAGLVSVISFVLAFIFFVLFIMSDKPGFQNTVIGKEGLWQRLNLFFMYVPLGYTALTRILAR